MAMEKKTCREKGGKAKKELEGERENTYIQKHKKEDEVRKERKRKGGKEEKRKAGKEERQNRSRYRQHRNIAESGGRRKRRKHNIRLRQM